MMNAGCGMTNGCCARRRAEREEDMPAGDRVEANTYCNDGRRALLISLAGCEGV